jgi:pimeloyl-ACP methyl ester carboxylesterase
MKIKNEYGESIDLLVEGKSNSSTTIIFVHGLGTNKNENSNLFIDIAKPLLEKYRIIRFDLSGYGESEGKQEEADLNKHAKDLKAVINFAESEYEGTRNILAFSLGCFVVLKLNPDNIEKTVFVSPPNPIPEQMIEATKARIESRPNGKVVEGGISVYPRSDGSVQKLGPTFWNTLRVFDPIESLAEYSNKTNVIVFRASQDEIVSSQNMHRYKELKTLKYVEIPGNHGFTNSKDRDKLIVEIQKFVKHQYDTHEPFQHAKTRV